MSTNHPFENSPSVISREEALRYTLNRYFQTPSPLPESMPAESVPWYTACQAEAIFFNNVIETSPYGKAEGWRSVRPFGGETPMLTDLLPYAEKTAVAMFPTCMGESEGQIYRLYVVHGKFSHDHRGYLSCVPGWLEGYSLFVVDDLCRPLSKKIDGNSWLLAAQFAKRVIQEGKMESRRNLAAGWLFTGGISLDEKAIQPVEIGGKTELFEKAKKQERQIMVPALQRENFEGLPVYRLGNMQDAWREFTKRGFKNVSIKLPEHVDSLHLLVGDNIRPVLIPLLLLQPRKATFWCSNITAKTGRIIEGAMRNVYPELETELKTMNELDMDQGYRDMDMVLKREKQEKYDVLISITGGNRLMGFAAFMAGRQNDVTLLYRERDSAQDQLVGIQKEEDEKYVTDMGILCARPIYAKPLNWNWLYKTERVTISNTADLLSELISG